MKAAKDDEKHDDDLHLGSPLQTVLEGLGGLAVRVIGVAWVGRGVVSSTVRVPRPGLVLDNLGHGQDEGKGEEEEGEGVEDEREGCAGGAEADEVGYGEDDGYEELHEGVRCVRWRR